MEYWLLGLFVFIAYTIQTMVGFGGVVIALSLGILVLPIEAMLPILAALSVTTTFYIVIFNWRSIDHRLLTVLVFPFMGLGVIAGIALRPYLAAAWLEALLAALLALSAFYQLRKSYAVHQNTINPESGTRSLTTLAGIAHGLIAAGGPVLVYALAGKKMDKAIFRATLATVWMVFNSVLSLHFWYLQSLQPKVGWIMAYLPLIALGIAVGEWLYRRVDQVRFERLVYGVLIVIGAFLVIRALFN